ncbi:hypothetical protein B0J12DRAFT_587363 [Macrophomina phaseolina]|uniref:Uncharacterized protein n=1 Tax=Macrophomina phaseolina TaxID=35725 RepID=A0ABQ8FPR5_9PEZI|nr:hypothetical protein B0J12DRAFT_587363 [Macrophomina phaseolina]
MAEKASGSGFGAGHGRPTAASRTRGTPGRYTRRNDGNDSGIGRSSSQTSRGARSTTSVSSRASSESGSTAVASRAPSAKFSDQDFKAHVLSPRGIRIDDETKSVTPFYHFDTSPPPQGVRAAYYQNLPGLSGATLWLESDDKFVEAVVREYASMGEYKLCEAEYASYAVESLLKREIRNPQLRETRHSMAERMIQLPTKPERMWHEPPLLDKSANPYKPFSFAMRPDCAYWISLQAFNPDYRKRVEEYVSVRLDRILCPYLTIEFKKDDSTINHARYQVAAASAIALYNRWTLKQQRLTEAGKAWRSHHVRALRHYGLTFYGQKYEVWCTEVSVADGAWSGCRMFRLSQDSFNTPRGVRVFVDWVNEIHRWGLIVHGPGCERDVKYRMRSTPGADRTSLDAEGVLDSDGEAEAGDEPSRVS